MYYFDNAATTFPKPEEVYTKMDNFYRNYGVNVGRGQFKEASTANKLLEDTRMMMLDLVCANSCYDCVFTSSATEAMNIILQGIQWSKDMNVYITPFAHNAILRTLHYLKNKYEINIITLYPDNYISVRDYDSYDSDFQVSPSGGLKISDHKEEKILISDINKVEHDVLVKKLGGRGV